MSIIDKLRVEPGKKIKLSKIDPCDTGKYSDDAIAQAKSDEHKKKLANLQYHLYSEGKQSLLICLQALDTGGKDGTINHVLSTMNPQGTRVHNFKAPSQEEAAHDFLWRAHLHTPAKGEIAIFNRSYYEDVLVVRVHNLVPKDVWSKRYDLINDFEQNLVQNGTRILKFYLHISPEEQLRRFKDRLDDPAKNWKISETDYKDRRYWPQYIDAYEDVFRKTSTKHAPWYIIPANNKWFRNLAVAKIVVDTMEDMKMELPLPKVDIAQIRAKYHTARRKEKALVKELQKSP